MMSNENRSTGADGERPDAELVSFDDPQEEESTPNAEGARMRKEARFGLAVIIALLSIFSYIVYNRLSGVDDGSAASTEAESEDSQPDADPAAGKSTAAASADSTQPTFEVAQAKSDAAGEEPPSTDLNLWSDASDDGRTEENTGTAGASWPPSYMPNPLPATPADRYAGYGSMQRTAPTSRTWESEPAGNAGAAAGQQPYDGSPGQATQVEPGEDQAGTSQAGDSAGPTLWSNGFNTPGRPDTQPAGDGYGAPAEQPNPLREQDRSAAPIQTSPAVSPFSSAGGYRYPYQTSPQPAQDQTGQSTGPSYAGTSYPAYRADPDPPGSISQAPASAETAQQSDVRRQYASREPATFRALAQPYVSGVDSSQIDAAQPRASAGGSAGASAGVSAAGDSVQQWVSGGSSAPSGSDQQPLWSQSPTAVDPVQPYSAAKSAAPNGVYVIQPNDNYWRISEKLYGTGAYFRALAEHNRARIRDENRLRIGDQILAPDMAELEKAYPALCPKPEHRRAAQQRSSLVRAPGQSGGRVYVVQQGDNLFDIARYELGKASRWVEVLDLNRDLIGDQIDYLTPGMKLILPEDQGRGTVTQRTDSPYQR